MHGIHLRTGCFCNTGACQQHVGLRDDEIIVNFQVTPSCSLNIGSVCLNSGPNFHKPCEHKQLRVAFTLRSFLCSEHLRKILFFNTVLKKTCVDVCKSLWCFKSLHYVDLFYSWVHTLYIRLKKKIGKHRNMLPAYIHRIHIKLHCEVAPTQPRSKVSSISQRHPMTYAY